jgi:uncharacterized protein (DUF608 family)
MLYLVYVLLMERANVSISRRRILVGAGGAIGASALGVVAPASGDIKDSSPRIDGTTESKTSGVSAESISDKREFNGIYRGEYLNHIAFPLGGIGAGMFCLEGTGALTKFSLRNHPDLVNEPKLFSAVCIKGANNIARVLEGPVPAWKLRPFFPAPDGTYPGGCWGLPRFQEATFEGRFPFAKVRLKDDEMPINVEITGWSPFSPGDSYNASLPIAAIEYHFLNRSADPVDAVFSFHTPNFLAHPHHSTDKKTPPDRIRALANGFVLCSPPTELTPWDEASLSISVDDPTTIVNPAWMRSIDSPQLVWKEVESAEVRSRPSLTDDSSPGASLFVSFSLAPGRGKTLTLHFAWFTPRSDLFKPAEIDMDCELVDCDRTSCKPLAGTYEPWYAGQFSSVDAVALYWHQNYRALRDAAERFSRALYDTSLPAEVVEAVASNLSILKSPTILRQRDGRLWGWEGTRETDGSCYGSSTHVWNYAQTIAHLFPELERTLRETEFGSNQNEEGHQLCRAALPIRPLETVNAAPDAADGQLGGIIKFYRDWRICGDSEWLRRWWPRVRASLDYCIKTWDPQRKGAIEEPHINTYDVEFWGADSMCTSLYLAALKAATLMGNSLSEDTHEYAALSVKCADRLFLLFNGEYFTQTTSWRELRTRYPRLDADSPSYPEFLEMAKTEGPPYQYGSGCLSDGLLGAWFAYVCGLGELLDADKTDRHLLAVHRYNFKRSLSRHVNTRRPHFACGNEAGLLTCTWPRGGRPSLAMIYADEVWTGVEHEVASHLISRGKIQEGLEIVRACRDRYDGRVRNPFDELEAGHWYARSMSSFALLQAFSGARFDAVEKVLYLEPAIKGDFRCFFSTATGYGTVGVKDGKPFVEVVSGKIPFKEIRYKHA